MAARSRFGNLDDEEQEKILRNAGEEFADKGYAEASLNAIIEKAGISKGFETGAAASSALRTGRKSIRIASPLLGEFWDEILAMGGATWMLARVKMRAEGVVPWHLDLGEVRLPRATAGLEWFGASWTAAYGDQFTSPAYLRGES